MTTGGLVEMVCGMGDLQHMASRRFVKKARLRGEKGDARELER